MRSWCISLSVVEWGGWAVSPGAVGAVGAVGAMGAGRGEGGCPVLISSAGMPTSVVQEVGWALVPLVLSGTAQGTPTPA